MLLQKMQFCRTWPRNQQDSRIQISRPKTKNFRKADHRKLDRTLAKRAAESGKHYSNNYQHAKKRTKELSILKFMQL